MKKKLFFIIFLGILAFSMFDYKSFKGLFNSVFSFNSKNKRQIEKLTTLIKNNPNDVWNYCYRGDLFLENKEYYLALDDYNQALSLNKKFSYVYPGKSLALVSIAKYDDALNTINYAIAEWPERVTYYFIKGIIYDYQLQSIDALKNYDSFLTCEETKDSKRLILFAMKRRSICLYRISKYQESYYEINKIYQSNPEYKDVKEILKILTILKDDKNSSLTLDKTIQDINLEESILIYLNKTK